MPLHTLVRAFALLAVSASAMSAQRWSGTFAPGVNPVYQHAYDGHSVGASTGSLSFRDAFGAPQPATGAFSFWGVDAAGAFCGGSVVVHRMSSLSGPTRSALAQAAYLTTLRNSATTATQMSNLHAAIWFVTGGISGAPAPSSTWQPASLSERDRLVQEAIDNSHRVNLDNFYYVEFADRSRQDLIFQGAGDPFEVPEPSLVILLGIGGALLAIVRRRAPR
jgi:hypothetical protein